VESSAPLPAQPTPPQPPGFGPGAQPQGTASEGQPSGPTPNAWQPASNNPSTWPSNPFSVEPPRPGGVYNSQPPPNPYAQFQPPGAAPYAAASYGYGPGVQQAPYGYPVARPAKLRQGMAITSLVLGCMGPFSCACALLGVGPIIGFVLGIVSTVKAQKYPSVYGGKVMGIIGVVLNGISLFVLLPFGLAIQIPNLMKARMAANELSAIQTLRSIGSAEATYQATNGNHREFGDLDQLVAAGLFRRVDQTKSGYKFDVKTAESHAFSGTTYKFEAFATPITYDSTGRRSYYTCEDFVIREADKAGKPAGRNDHPIDPIDLNAESPSRASPPGGVPGGIPGGLPGGEGANRTMQGNIQGNETNAVRTIRTIATAEATFQSMSTGGAYASLDQLVRSGLVARGTENKDGYRFEVRATERRENSQTVHRFEVFATPAVYNSTGRRSYYTCEDLVIRGADKSGGQANNTDPPTN